MSDTPIPVTQETSQEPKTFVQRFQELESLSSQLSQVVSIHSSVFQSLIQEVSSLRETCTSVRNVLNAMLKLFDESKAVNTAATVAKYTEMQAEMFKKNIEDSLKAGTIKAVDEVKSLEHIVAFSSDDVLYGYSKVSEFVKEELRKAMESAKVGDLIEGLRVLGVYESVAPSPEQPAPTEPQPTEQPLEPHEATSTEQNP